MGGGLLLTGLIVSSLGVLNRPREGKLLARQPEKIWQPSVEAKNGLYVRPDLTEFVRYEVENIGRTAVRVKSVETTCGCTSAYIEPTVIHPGTTAVVRAYPNSFPTGEMMVAITLHTDSPLTPSVELRLRNRGTMRPPYLHDVRGDLTFKGKLFTSTSESRTFEISLVDTEGSSPRPPEIRTDLSFLSLSPPVLTRVGIFPGSNAPVRTYTSTVRFVREPPAPYVSGAIVVLDPWHSERTKKLPVSVEVLPALRAAPSRILIAARSSGPTAPATLVVLCDEPNADLRLDIPDGSPLLIRREMVNLEATRAVFSISLRPDLPAREGEYRLTIRPSTSSAEPITIPVHIQLETSS